MIIYDRVLELFKIEEKARPGNTVKAYEVQYKLPYLTSMTSIWRALTHLEREGLIEYVNHVGKPTSQQLWRLVVPGRIAVDSVQGSISELQALGIEPEGG